MATKESKTIAQLKGDLGAAVDLFKQYFPQQGLQHINAMRPGETSNLLAMRQAYTPAGGAANRPFAQVLARFKSGLRGYNAPEMTAFRNSARREINKSFGSRERDLRNSQARSGVRGAIVQAQAQGLNQEKTNAHRLMGEDLMRMNADRKISALDSYRGALFGENERQRNAIGDYENTLGNALNRDRENTLFNISQDEKTQARDIGGQLGLLGLLTNRRQSKEIQKGL